MQLPEDIKPVSVIYVYANGDRYECLDVKNMLKNLSASGALAWSHGLAMDPVEWVKIPEPLEYPMGVSQWRNHGIKWGYDKFFKLIWPKEKE
jgi:hypothetical protein